MLTKAFASLALLALASVPLTASLPAQVAGVAPSQVQAPAPATPTSPGNPKPKRQAPHPLAEQAPGGGPDKVWVNLSSAKYHCFGDRYYGRTSSGRYMTQAAAKSAGARGPRGKDCPAVPKQP